MNKFYGGKGIYGFGKYQHGPKNLK